MRPALTIVLPCYNEADGIVRSLRVLRARFLGDTQILVIDDGSTDRTADLARQHAESQGDERIHVHVRPANGGKGASIRAAIGPAAGEHVVLVDANLAFGRDFVDRGGVAGTSRGRHRNRQPAPRRVPLLGAGAVVRLSLPPPPRGADVQCAGPNCVRLYTRDTQCGLKAFRRGALERLGRGADDRRLCHRRRDPAGGPGAWLPGQRTYRCRDL